MRIKELMSGLALFVGLNVVSISASAQSKDFEMAKNLDIFVSAFMELQNMYVDSLRSEDLARYAIEGMTDHLDPYTEFVPSTEQDDFDFIKTGRYAGIGSYIQKDGDYTRISLPYKGFPADLAGFVSGDRLLEIDGKSLKGMSVDKVSSLLKGEAGTGLKLKVHKWLTGDTVSVELTRQNIRMPSVKYSGILEGGVGYILLTTFTTGSFNEFRSALVEMRNTGNLKSLIIDLRGNGGGSLPEAVKIVNLFVPKGIAVVKARGRIRGYDMSYTTTEDPLEPDLPLAVLVNGASASASEIVSGTIQDLDRGLVVGTLTFGKGLVQAVRPLVYDAQLKITAAKYYIPSGRCVQAHNFSHRNSDGSVSFIPDSLKKEFKTKNGRSVFDGGGITPDLTCEAEDYSPVAVSLLRRNLIFDYALQYFKKTLKISSPEVFDLNDREYQAFVDFLSTKDYDYESLSERMLKQFVSIVKQEKYDEEVKEELERLSEKLKHDKSKDLRLAKDELKALLREEIAERYFYESGRIRAMLRRDNQLTTAQKLLSDSERYSGLLSPKK
ncbi:MAG: S41 family peptidase [Prevotellaceae bacterium]|nr:S41 family peptidase [Prevotellaceae bacterium]